MTRPFVIPQETTCIALDQRRDVNLIMPWFAPKSKHPHRAHNVIEPLVVTVQVY